MSKWVYRNHNYVDDESGQVASFTSNLDALKAVNDHNSAEDLREAVDLVTASAGCGDNSCMFVRPKGMATNGGCRCLGRGGDHRPGLPMALATLYRAAKSALEGR